jgi:hypothetical protein
MMLDLSLEMTGLWQFIKMKGMGEKVELWLSWGRDDLSVDYFWFPEYIHLEDITP